MPVVRLLFHSDDATYDAQSKTYYFNLDRKIHFPNKMRFVKCQYANKTTEVHPLVVFVRSHELSKLIKADARIRIMNNTSLSCAHWRRHTKLEDSF
jgi:hypothetical protein